MDDEQLAAIYDLMKWAPTGGNTQPLRILFIRSPEAKERLIAHLNEGNRDKTRSAPVVAVLAADTSFHEHLGRLFPQRPEMKDYFAADDALRERQAKFNATLQAGYFLLAVRAMGLAAGPMGGFDEEKYARPSIEDIELGRRLRRRGFQLEAAARELEAESSVAVRLSPRDRHEHCGDGPGVVKGTERQTGQPEDGARRKVRTVTTEALQFDLAACEDDERVGPVRRSEGAVCAGLDGDRATLERRGKGALGDVDEGVVRRIRHLVTHRALPAG